MKSRRLTVVLLSAALAACPILLHGADKPAGPGTGSATAGGGAGTGAVPAPDAPAVETVTRVYNVRDLIRELPDFPAMPRPLPGGPVQNPFGAGMGSESRGGGLGTMTTGSGAASPGGAGGANGLFPGQPAGGAPGMPMGGGGPEPGTLAARVDELTKIIIETVSPETWRDTGGNEGVIRFFNGALVITQTAAAHDKIRKLLTDLRGDQSAMVRVRARWVLLKPTEFDRVVKENNAAFGGGGPGRAFKSVLQEVNVAELDKVAVHSVQFRAQTTCFSGQTVSVASGRQKSVVSTVEAVVGTDAGAYQPTVGFLSSGLTLQIRPTFNLEDETVVLTIDSTYTGPSETSPAMAGHLIGPATRPTAGLGNAGQGLANLERLPAAGQLFSHGPADPGGLIDRINVVSQNLKTSVRVPLEKSVLIGGMTLEPADNGDESPQLYLIIEASASM